MRRTMPSAVEPHVDQADGRRALGDLRHGRDQGRRRAVRRRRLEELRQVDLARAGDGGGQGVVGGAVLGRLAEQHVVDDRLGAGLAEPVDHLGVTGAIPRPGAQRAQAALVDADDQDRGSTGRSEARTSRS
jgi:hypothetical protein